MSLNVRRLVGGGGPGRDPLAVWRIVLGVLLAANIVAGGLVLFPPGGSADQLDRDLTSLRQRVQSQRVLVNRMRSLVTKVETARADQEAFMREYFIDSEASASTIIAEIGGLASKAGLVPKGDTYELVPVEGSDTISMMTITSNCEGTYGDLIQFVNMVDRSDRFLIIDNITATPMQAAGTLSARFRLNTFVRELTPAAPVVRSANAEAAQ